MGYTTELCECGHCKVIHRDKKIDFNDWRLLALRTRLSNMPLVMLSRRRDYLRAMMKACEAELTLRLVPHTADKGGNLQAKIEVENNGSCKECGCKEFRCKELVY